MRRILFGATLAVLLPSIGAADEAVGIAPVAGSVYMVSGSGGNVGISVGDDGVFMIDDDYAPLTDEIKDAIATVSDAPIRFVINTHWHSDHVGGNVQLGGEGAIIVAHDNVRARLSTDQFMSLLKREVEATPPVGLPMITFTRRMHFHLNGDEIRVMHMDRAHTDGDAVVYFSKTNVIHAGDIFWNGQYPFIDTGSGGSVDGTLRAVKAMLDLADEETKIIPGHGMLATRAELEEYYNMLSTIRARLLEHLNKRHNNFEMVAAKPSAEFDEKWGKGFIKPARLLEIMYADLGTK